MKKYNTRGKIETCLNCGKKSCNLSGVGNVAGINENDGCWIPIHRKLKNWFFRNNNVMMRFIKMEIEK